MIAKKMKPLIENNSVIRAMFVEGALLAERVGAENVFDFSIGNPNVPAPESVKKAMLRLLNEEEPVKLHGYMNNAGFEETRKAIADKINRDYNLNIEGKNIIMTVGAAGAINVILKTIIDPGDEVIVLAPYFVEYSNYIGNYDGKTVVVDTDESKGFLPDVELIGKAITPRTKAIIINNPNNPTGVIYPEKTIRELCEMLTKKEEELGISICLISDEPYRELAYDGVEVPYLPCYYHNAVVAYSYSKSLSLPGERIGYIMIPNSCHDSENFLEGAVIANRVMGCVNAPSLIQLAIISCLDEKCDVEFYHENGKILYEALKEFGFECVKPQGAFYLWLKSPVPDDNEFVKKAKEYNILMVPGSAFAGKGYVRLSYCISREKIERSLAAFKLLAENYF